MRLHRIAPALLAGFLTVVSLPSLADEDTRAKALADAAKAESDSRRTDLLSPAEKAKLEAETAKLIAEAYKALTEAHLNEARTQQIYTEIAALQQRMRMADYEFQRIVGADYQMNNALAEIERNMNLVRPLAIGRCNWKTWQGLEYLMMNSGEFDIIIQVMFEVPVPVLPVSEFVANSLSSSPRDFVGGNLGELYSFVRDNDVSFHPYGVGHHTIMKVVAMINKAVELKEQELRDINQSIRLTLVRITNS